MHIIDLPNSIDLGPQGQREAGSYLVEDRNAAELMLRSPGSTMRPWERFLPVLPEGLHASVLVIAPIGFGDAILLTPCLRHLKSISPNATITVACLPEYRQPYLGLNYVDGFEDYPTPTAALSKYDCVLCLERSVEDNPLAREQHMTDRYAQHLGLGELKDKRADYVVSGDERTWVFDSFPKTANRRIGVQIQSGARCRSYPRIGLMVEALRREHWEVALLGRPGEFRADGSAAGIIDVSRRGLTWRQSAAFLLTCDVVLAPDSSLMHVAGALNIPTVAIFGPFPWNLRTAYYTSVFAIQGRDGCDLAPCFNSPHTGKPEFPLNGPCALTGRCVVMDSVLPKRVLAKIEQVYARSAGAEKGLPLSKSDDAPESTGDTLPAVRA